MEKIGTKFVRPAGLHRLPMPFCDKQDLKDGRATDQNRRQRTPDLGCSARCWPWASPRHPWT
jgi:hypothetical protein